MGMDNCVGRSCEWSSFAQVGEEWHKMHRAGQKVSEAVLKMGVIKETYCYVMFRVEEILRITGKEVRRDEAVMSVEHCRRPFPDAAIGTLAPKFGQSHSRSKAGQNRSV